MLTPCLSALLVLSDQSIRLLDSDLMDKWHYDEDMAELHEEPAKPDLDFIHTVAPGRGNLRTYKEVYMDCSSSVTPSVFERTKQDFKSSLKTEVA